MSSFQDFNQTVIDEFRANGGVVNAMGGMPMLLVTTKGAKSGKSRINPVAFFKDGDDWVVVASKGGQPSNPDWYYNLLANPVVDLETGAGEHIAARATAMTEGTEHDRLYAKMVAINPGFAEYERKTTRKIPVVKLERVS